MRVIVSAMLILAVFVSLAVFGYGYVTRGETVTQPIAFNHAAHLGDAGMECIDCHTDAATGVYAGLPGRAICFDCHDLEDEENEEGQLPPEKARLLSFVESEGDIPWLRVAVTKPDVFFSHRRHVTSGKIDCLHCHPNQAELTEPPSTAQLVMTMDDCIACHDQDGVSTDCLACHR